MSDFKCSYESCITPEQAAEFFQVSVYTIKNWLRQGKLEGFRLGGKDWRTTMEACNKFIEKSKNSS